MYWFVSGYSTLTAALPFLANEFRDLLTNGMHSPPEIRVDPLDPPGQLGVFDERPRMIDEE